jgi:hypothetical protein
MIVRFDKNQQHLIFASARNPLFIMGLNGDEAIEVLAGDRKGAGYANTPMDATWHNHIVPITEAKRIFLITDGVIDQVGGVKKNCVWQATFVSNPHRRP